MANRIAAVGAEARGTEIVREILRYEEMGRHSIKLFGQLATPKEIRIKEHEYTLPSRKPLWSDSEDITEELAELPSLNEEPVLPPSIEELKSRMLALGWCIH
jgi:hypothetical protein